jgi:hypothetical protein
MAHTISWRAAACVFGVFLASAAAGPTDGFGEQKLTFKVQHPYDVKEGER